MASDSNPKQRIAVVIATGNRDKVREMEPVLRGVNPCFEILSLKDLSLEPEIEETEPTLEGNARLKADAVFRLVEDRFPWMLVLADDTGLEVDALGGAPGVRSARFAPAPAGAAPTYQENVRHLMALMEGKTLRTARFRTVIAMKGRLPGAGGAPVSVDETVEGRIDGTITCRTTGSGGFGYDPVFMPEGGRRTFAEMTIEEKNSISHRGRALEKAAERMRTLACGCGTTTN